MNQSTSVVVEDLENLYLALQRLHRALATADATRICESVREVGDLSQKLNEVNPATINAGELKNMRQLVQRIRSLQKINQALCEGGLRTVRWCTELLTPNNSYDPEGRSQATAQVTGMNLSA